MTNIIITEATLSHVQELAKTMNIEHVLEYEGIGLKAHRSLWRSWKKSMLRKTAIIDGEVAACWGVCGSLLGVLGKPWLVTNSIARGINPHVYARLYRTEVREMLTLFPVLENWCDNSYIGAVKLLKLSGFQLDEPIPLGKMKRLYRRFYKVS